MSNTTTTVQGQAHDAPIVNSGDVTRSNTYNIDPRLLVCDPTNNVRWSKPTRGDLLEMAKSLASLGQLQPIKVIREGKHLRVTMGFHRTMAAVLGIEEGILPSDFRIRYEVEEKGLTDLDHYLHRVAENVERKSLSPMDKARIIRDLTLVHGYDLAEAGKVLGKSRSWASSCRKLLDLDTPYQSLIHKGTMSQDLGYEVLTSPDQEMAHKILGNMMSDNSPLNTLEFRRRMREAMGETGGEGGEGVNGDGERGGGKESGDGEERRQSKATKRTVTGPVPSTKTKRSMGEFRTFLKGVIDKGGDGPVQVCGDILSYLDGKVGERFLLKTLNREWKQ